MQTSDRVSYLALPLIAVAVALVVAGPVLWSWAPMAAAVSGGFAFIVGIPVLWLLRRIGADRSWVVAAAGGVLGGMSWGLGSRGASGFEVLVPMAIGTATGAIYGIVQNADQISSSSLRIRVVCILAAAICVVASALNWLPSKWPPTERNITARASWSVGSAVDARGVREIVIAVDDPPCRVSVFLPELEPFLVAQRSNEIAVVLSLTKRLTATQMIVKSVGEIQIPYPTTQDISCKQAMAYLQ